MTTFKVGDKVRALKSAADIKEGNTYVVDGDQESNAFPGHLAVVDDVGEQNALLKKEDFVLLQNEEPAFDLLEALLGAPLKFRSGCDVTFVAYVKDAKPHCQLVLLNPATGNVVTRYANGKSSTETYGEPGDILVK